MTSFLDYLKSFRLVTLLLNERSRHDILALSANGTNSSED